MIAALFGLNVAALLMAYRSMTNLLGRVIGLVYFAYMAAFVVLKPGLLYYYEMYFPYSTNEDFAVQSLLTGSLIFLVTQCFGLRWLAPIKASGFALNAFDFDSAPMKGIYFACLLLMGISMVGCAIKFGSFEYLFSAVDSFEATMNLADGAWYINYIAEILFYGLLVFVGCTYWRYSTIKSFSVMALGLVVTVLWVKLAARTPALVVLVAWLATYFTIEQQRRVKLFYIAIFGYALLVLLYVGNLVRLGDLDSFSPDTALFGAVFAAVSDLAPVDNATLLYADISKFEGTNFFHLLGAINPMVLVPSSLFPFKIPADKDAELTRIFFPQGVDTAYYHAGSTLTFTIPGSGYADFGYVGVFVASILYVVLLCWYIRIQRQGSRSARFVATYQIIVLIVGFRLSVETMFIAFYTSLMFFWFIRRIAFFVGTIGSRSPSSQI